MALSSVLWQLKFWQGTKENEFGSVCQWMYVCMYMWEWVYVYFRYSLAKDKYTYANRQIGSSLKTNVLCIAIASSRLLRWLFTMPAVDCKWSAAHLPLLNTQPPTHTHTHTHTHLYTNTGKHNINIQFKLLPNWLSQISIMHLFHFHRGWRRLKAADVCNFHSTTHRESEREREWKRAREKEKWDCFPLINKQFNLSIDSRSTINKIHQLAMLSLADQCRACN